MGLLAACTSGGDDGEASLSDPTTVTLPMTDGTGATIELTTSGITSSAPGETTEDGGTTAGDSEGAPTSTGTDTGESTGSTGEPDLTTGPPLPDPFTAGHVFVAGWNDHRVFGRRRR